ncbi:MAG: Acetoin utilization protein AcuC [Chthonomonadaceae bacterium]|nr:Acetoin utilization protein AcuC [Chthonomonadaceae bacterium]
MARPLFFYTDAFAGYNFGPQHPLKPRRLGMTYDLLDSYGVFENALEVVEPQHADEAEVAETHSVDYLEALSRMDRDGMIPQARRYGVGTGDVPFFPEIYGSSLLYTGASAQAAQAIIDGAGGGRVAFNISGGLHHAHYARAAGFCVLNDCAVALHRLRRHFDRVAYVDIDVHHGDGVQELFFDDPSVLTISLHESGRTLFPGTGYTDEIGVGAGEGFAVNLPFAPYTEDETWIEAWRSAALPILRAFDPEAIVLQMGTDTHVLDPMAHLCLTAQGWLEAVKDVQALGKPIVAVGGGGYNLTTVTRMWTLAVTTLAGIDVPDTVPASYRYRDDIPTLRDHETFTVPAREAKFARDIAARSVEELQALLFPRYGLS